MTFHAVCHVAVFECKVVKLQVYHKVIVSQKKESTLNR